MESEDILLLDPPRPTHDTTGDVLRFLSEMKKQSTRQTMMEERGVRMEQLLEAQGQTIVELHQAVQEVEAKLSNQSGPPIHRATPGSPQSQVDRSIGARTRQVPRLPRAPEPPVVVHPQGEDSLQNNSRHSRGRGRDTIQCDRCGQTITIHR